MSKSTLRTSPRTLYLAVLGLSLASIVTPRRALAIDPDVRTVLTAGMYGAAAGTFFGLAAYPLTRNTRTIFIGTSIGLYLGLIAGVYHASNRDNPDNPFNLAVIDRGPNRAGIDGMFASYRVARF